MPFVFGDRKAWLHENGVVVNEYCTDNGFKFEVNWTALQKAKYQSFTSKYYWGEIVVIPMDAPLANLGSKDIGTYSPRLHKLPKSS